MPLPSQISRMGALPVVEIRDVVDRMHEVDNSINIQGSNNQEYSDYTYIQNQVDSLFSTRNLVLVLVVIQVIEKIVPLAKTFFGFGWILSSCCVIVLAVGAYYIFKPIVILVKDFLICAYLVHKGLPVPGNEDPYTLNFALRRLGLDVEACLPEPLI